jgi:hypothetical protein
LADQTDLLRHKLDDLRRENERLRDARSAITSQLGPMPISAAIVAGLVSGFTVTGKAHLDRAFAIGALVAFGLMVLVSMVSSVMKPYRALRDQAERKLPKPRDATNLDEWYERAIEIEEEVRGISTDSHGLEKLVRAVPLPRPGLATDLQSACDQEWRGLFLTKTLFVAAIVLLILARIQ